jgi:hypothetical protein
MNTIKKHASDWDTIEIHANDRHILQLQVC